MGDHDRPQTLIWRIAVFVFWCLALAYCGLFWVCLAAYLVDVVSWVRL